MPKKPKKDGTLHWKQPGTGYPDRLAAAHQRKKKKLDTELDGINTMDKKLAGQQKQVTGMLKDYETNKKMARSHTKEIASLSVEISDFRTDLDIARKRNKKKRTPYTK